MRVQRDKILHFFVGGGIIAFLYPFINLCAIAVLCVATISKEVWDYYDDETKKDVELWDIIATLAGGAVAYLLLVFA